MPVKGKGRPEGTGENMASAGSSMRRIGLWLAGALVAGAVAACAPVYRNHGYVPTDDELAEVQVGADSRDSVAEKLGRPSAEGLLNDEGWFYVQSRWRHYGAKEPQEIDRQVVSITFDNGGTVQNIERFGLDRGEVVVLSRRVTESNIKGIGFLRQLLGNLGRFRADQFLQQ